MDTGVENLELAGRLHGMTTKAARARAAELLARFALEPAARRQVKTYSGGMARKLDVAIGLMHRPQVLFLDEPTTGLDPEARAEMWAEIQGMARHEQMTVLLTTHYLEEADQLADRLAIIDRGRVVAEGTPEELRERAARRRRRHGAARPAGHACRAHRGGTRRRTPRSHRRRPHPAARVPTKVPRLCRSRWRPSMRRGCESPPPPSRGQPRRRLPQAHRPHLRARPTRLRTRLLRGGSFHDHHRPHSHHSAHCTAAACCLAHPRLPGDEPRSADDLVAAVRPVVQVRHRHSWLRGRTRRTSSS